MGNLVYLIKPLIVSRAFGIRCTMHLSGLVARRLTTVDGSHGQTGEIQWLDSIDQDRGQYQDQGQGRGQYQGPVRLDQGLVRPLSVTLVILDADPIMI